MPDLDTKTIIKSADSTNKIICLQKPCELHHWQAVKFRFSNQSAFQSLGCPLIVFDMIRKCLLLENRSSLKYP
jgi:hypothetical protein